MLRKWRKNNLSYDCSETQAAIFIFGPVVTDVDVTSRLIKGSLNLI